jgi:hypothetical protein
MTTEKLSLHKKLAQVMYEADRIPKNGVAPAAMGGFRFVQVGDAADAIRKALAEKSVSMIPTAIEVVGETEHATSSGKMMTTLTVRTTWTLTDGDSGETTVIQSLGAGADMGDKAAPKAQSSAMKYALLMGFLLSTGDDPEQTDTSDRQARPAPARLPARVDPNESDPPPPGPEPYSETEELIGRKRQRGIIRKGGPDIYQLKSTPHPEGRTIGLKLETAKGNIPQCLVEGPLGEALYLATGKDPEILIGVPATVAGILNYVKDNRGNSWYRLHVDRIETTIKGLDVILPADDLEQPPDDIELVGEAPTAPLFDDVAVAS